MLQTAVLPELIAKRRATGFKHLNLWSSRQTVVSMRDAALWIIPALLPLYIFSGGQKTTHKAPTALEVAEPLISKEMLNAQVLEDSF